MVGRMCGRADAKERLAGGERVAVEDRLGGAAAPRFAADQRMLSAFAMAGEIGIGPVGSRNVRIVFLDPCLHLREQGFLQRNGSGEGGLRIGVFRLEVGADVGIEQGSDRASPPANRGLLSQANSSVRVTPCRTALDGRGGARGGARDAAANLGKAVELMHNS